MTILTSTTTGVFLNSPTYTYTNPIVINLGVSITNYRGDAIYASYGFWTITNSGFVAGTDADSIYLPEGGVVTNEKSGVIGFSSGAYSDIYITGAPGTVTNYGTINAGVWLQDDGTVTNQTGARITSTDPSGGYGVGLHAGGTVTNAGQISGLYIGIDAGAGGGSVINQTGGTVNGPLFGVEMGFPGQATGGGGSLVNQAGGIISGDIGFIAEGSAATINNTGVIMGTFAGRVSANGSIFVVGPGVSLGAGGTVTNQSGGTITGASYGVDISNGAGTVINFGSIASTGTNGFGVYLSAGGLVTNAARAVITGGGIGVFVTGGAGTVDNYGSIAGANGRGVDLGSGGSFTNEASAAITGAFIGVLVGGGAGTVDNYGSIASPGTSGVGVFLSSGGSLTNEASASIIGAADGVYLRGGTAVNDGSIAGTGTLGYGVELGSGASVTNAASASITGVDRGVVMLAVGTLVNYGSIAATGTNGAGVFLRDGGSVTNAASASIMGGGDGVVVSGGAGTLVNDGSITSTGVATGVFLSSGGSITNKASATIAGRVGVGLSGAGTLVNYGSVAGDATSGTGVGIGAGACVTNQSGGTISGYIGISGAQGSVTIVNAGSIAGSTTSPYGRGVRLDAGGSVTNRSGASISGRDGIYDQVALTVVNYGSITALGSTGFAVELLAGGLVSNAATGSISSSQGVGIRVAGAAGTVVNAGVIASSGSADAVSLGGGFANRVVVDPGAVFAGTVDGGNAVGAQAVSTLELASGTSVGTLSGLGTTFINFGTVIVDAGTTWTVEALASALASTTIVGDGAWSTLVLTTAGAFGLGGVSNVGTIDLAAGNSTVTVTDATLSGGAVTINDGASGNNTISAASDTSASKGKSLTYNAGTGTDSFTGGFENDLVNVSPAAVGGDTLTGGSGTNTLKLTSAGSVNLGGVSKFATIDLAAGNSTVTLTDTTLSGGAVALHDGASGNNTVSAAGDTSASTGKTLTYYTGSGTDSFTGGFENDAVHVSVASVAKDTLTGGSGSNTLSLSSAGSVNLGGVSRFTTIDLAAGSSTVTVTDKTLSGGSAGIHDGASGNNSVSALGNTSASTGKSLTYFTGSGTDSFTGGFENDTVNVTAAAVGGDTLTGGSGVNTLVLTSAGSANLGGVKKFGRINLAAGSSTVTVTDTTLSGGAVSIYDGSSGNNTVSAAGDTSASTGKSLNYYIGSGKDSFTGGFENDTVHAAAAALAGATLTGGSGTNVLMLTNTGTANLGGISNFATIDLFAGNTTVDASVALIDSVVLNGSAGGNTLVFTTAGSINLGQLNKVGTFDLAAGNNTVTVTDSLLSGVSIAINDGASGNNSVSAATDTSASKGRNLTFTAGTGTDSLTGGFENDLVHVAAAAVGGDTFVGGSGTNILTLSSAGSANLGGVRKFPTINLAAGNSTVTLTDTTLSGGAVALHDGASGNNSVSAAVDTSASTGKVLTWYAGTGKDSFTGGFENDLVYATAAAVSGDTLTGGSGPNSLTLTGAGSVNLGGVSKFGTINLAAGNSTVTVTDTTLSGGSLTLADGTSGNNTVSAATDTSASKGKTLVYYAGSGADKFTGGFENDAVHVSAAAVGGDTLTAGSGGNSLSLTSAGSVNLGGVSKFGTINLAAGSSTVTVTDTTLSGGAAGVHDGASGNNSVSAAGDTSASSGKTLTYFTGSGTDTFTGGFENDTVNVTAAAVGGDVLTGGSGSNKLTLSSAGSVGLGGVSHFGNVALAAGNSTVTVTDTTLSGGSVTINDGTSGSNSVSAAGDTSASSGKSLVYVAGNGADNFTGGFENDTIYAGTGLGTYTAGSGSDMFVFIKSSLASQTLGNFQVGSDDILVYGTHSAGGFDLGSTDNPLNPGTPTAIDPSIFIASASGAFTSSTQRFAYDASNGQLHYSATGSNTSESLVATLTNPTGPPAITASNLLFER